MSLRQPWTDPDAYIRFNFFSAIGLLLLFTLLFLGTDSGVIACPFNEIGSPCKACGLTRDIKTILTGNYSSGLINKSSLWIFLLMAGQFLIRVALSMFAVRGKKKTIALDFSIFLSLLLVVILSLYA